MKGKHPTTHVVPHSERCVRWAASIIFSDCSQLGAVGKELVAFGDEQHDAPRLGVGHCTGDSAPSLSKVSPAFGVSSGRPTYRAKSLPAKAKTLISGLGSKLKAIS